jgi:formate hydrogenlyase subunit 3/multisubunit Na+/H+ antiporter MnhD subunit
MILLALLLIPLVAAALSWLARGRPAMEKINLACFAAIFGLSLVLCAEVLRAGSASLWGGFLYADHLSALVILLTASVALLCATYAVG